MTETKYEHRIEDDFYNGMKECRQNDKEKRTAKYMFKKVAGFGRGMLTKLRDNNHKPHWKDYDISYCLHRLDEEVVELKDAIKKGIVKDILKETWDVANWAMIIWDNTRRNADENAKQESTGGGDTSPR